MAKEPSTTTGSAVATPKQEPRWIDLKEAEKLERYINRRFVPKDDPETAKKFFFVVEAIIPYTPVGFYDPHQHCYQFLIQKYHRNKTEQRSVLAENGSSTDMEVPVKVPSHVLNDKGFWEVVDKNANRFIDTDQFKKEFVADNVE